MSDHLNEKPHSEVSETSDNIMAKPHQHHVEPHEDGSVGEHITVFEPEHKITRQTVLAFLALNSQFNAYILTLLIPSTILSTINADLGPDPNYTWITVSWTLSASILVSVGGRLSDIFGRRYFMLTGAVFGLLGCIVGATAHSINQMIASGVILGFGSGFQESVFACVQEIVPNKHRVAALGLFEICCIPAFLGPIIAAGFITTSVGWRGAYYYMVAFHACGLILLFFTYHPPTFGTKHSEDGKTKMQLVKEMDFVGLLLGVAGCVLFLLGVNWGGRQYPWNSAAVIAPMVVGVVCLIALGFWEVYAPLKYPLMPPRLFRKTRKFTMVLVVCFVGGMLYYSLNVLWPRESGLLFTGTDTIIKGVYSNMIPFGTMIAAFIVTFFCARVGYERWQLFGFIVIETAMVGSLATLTLTSKAQAIATVIILSAMITPPNILAFTMLSLGIDDQTDIGIAVGLAGTIRLLGGAIATSIYTAIVNNGFSAALPDTLRSETAQFNLPASNFTSLLTAANLNTAAAYKAVPGITSTVIAAANLANQKAYVSAFRTCYLVAIAFGAVAMVAAFYTQNIDKNLKTSARAVTLENEAPLSKELEV